MATTTASAEPMPPVLSVAQASELLGLSLRSTYRAIEHDAIPTIRSGRRIMIPTAKLLEQLGLPIDGVEWTLS